MDEKFSVCAWAGSNWNNSSNGGFSGLNANDNNFSNSNNNGSGRVASVGLEKVRIQMIPF